MTSSPIANLVLQECRSALKIRDGVSDSSDSSYTARPTPKIGFNHVSFFPERASVEIQNIASALARIYQESAEALPNIEISAKMSPRSNYEGYFLTPRRYIMIRINFK